MKKIPSLFVRDFEGDPSFVTRRVTPDCEWAVEGQGYAMVKWDGTACMLRDDVMFKRYDAKPGRTPPAGFEPCQAEPDPHTGHHPGWAPVTAADKWHLQAFSDLGNRVNGTYELIGPKVQGNPYGIDRHILIPHWMIYATGIQHPVTFDSIRRYLQQTRIEGIVWHHTDGRMAKIKARDFALEWPPADKDQLPFTWGLAPKAVA